MTNITVSHGTDKNMPENPCSVSRETPACETSAHATLSHDAVRLCACGKPARKGQRNCAACNATANRIYRARRRVALQQERAELEELRALKHQVELSVIIQRHCAADTTEPNQVRTNHGATV
ncbi:MAG: hypothetical protein WCD42_02775 [Rhizomicrobium sp.]